MEKIFEEAVAKLSEKEILALGLSSREWQRVAWDIREKAFFSAGLESGHFLSAMKKYTTDYVAVAREASPDGQGTMLTAQGRAEFVANMRELMGVSEGNLPSSEGDLRDIRSIERLELIFDTQVENAQEFGYFIQGQSEEIRRAFPARRFIRVREVKTPRPYHAANEGEVRRIDDDAFWVSLNRDFGVPWGPWGYRSGMGVEDVDREEAQALGLLTHANDVPRPSKYLLHHPKLEGGKAMDDEIKAEVIDITGAQLQGNGTIQQRENFNQHQDERKTETRTERKALTTTGGGERESHPKTTQPRWHDHHLTDAYARGMARDLEKSGRDISPRWTLAKSGGDGGGVADRAIEAQVVAAALGRKPLYFEPWGEDGLARKFAEAYREVLPPSVEVVAREGMLYVFTRAAIEEVAAGDPSFYQQREREGLEDMIHRLTLAGENGELLGYGARTIFTRPGYDVRILKGGRVVLYFFTSVENVIKAEQWALARAEDFVRAFGWADVSYLMEFHEKA